jgi:hypothetical protein
MNAIAEILFITLGIVIGSGLIVGLLISVDERNKYRKSSRHFDEK